MSEVTGTQEILVAIALVRCGDEYLVGERGASSTLSGYAEFPGGKCLPRERPEDCVVRECYEETGLDVHVLRQRCEIGHTYPYSRVRLIFFDCAYDGAENPRPPFRWMSVDELRQLRFPEANDMVISELIAAPG